MSEEDQGVTQARHEEHDQPTAIGEGVRHGSEQIDAASPARQKAKGTDDSAGKRGRQMTGRLVRMHGGWRRVQIG